MDIDKEALKYDLESLKDNLSRCDDNIKTFEDAIQKELETKKELRRMIDFLENKMEQ